MDQDAPTRRGPRGRSPSYPGVALDVCIERARAFYQSEHRNSAPVAGVLRLWGYTNPSTGSATVALAALKKFGLVDDEGSGANRTVRLTSLALDVCLQPDESERKDLIKQAALTPKIHRELWDLYGGHLPSDETLRFELVRNRSFTAQGAVDFIKQFRSTVTYAQLGLDSFDAGGADVEFYGAPEPTLHAAPPRVVVPDPATHEAGEMTIPIPLPGGVVVSVTGGFPLDEKAWTQFLAVLAAMKPGLVTPEAAHNANEAPTNP